MTWYLYVNLVRTTSTFGQHCPQKQNHLATQGFRNYHCIFPNANTVKLTADWLWAGLSDSGVNKMLCEFLLEQKRRSLLALGWFVNTTSAFECFLCICSHSYYSYFVFLGILEVLHCVLVESPEALNIIKEGHIKSIISLLDKHGRNYKVEALTFILIDKHRHVQCIFK